MRVIIVANGIISEPVKEFSRWVDENTVFVGVDGGTTHLLACGYTPHYVIGDLDSLTSKVRRNLLTHGVTFHTHPPHKDETDLELALIWTVEQWPESEIVVLGAMGGRPDQALANLLLVSLPQLKGEYVVLAEGNWRVWVIRGGETRNFDGSVGDTLSLIPLAGEVGGDTTTGLRYPLNGETLRFGPTRGVSNVFKEERVRVSVEEGMLWCFYEDDSSHLE